MVIVILSEAKDLPPPAPAPRRWGFFASLRMTTSLFIRPSV